LNNFGQPLGHGRRSTPCQRQTLNGRQIAVATSQTFFPFTEYVFSVSYLSPGSKPGLFFDEHIEGDGPTVFAHACKMGLEGIVSKRKDSAYRVGRSTDWLKKKNPNAPAVTREAEEDWS
jgi:hypothetical protein